MNNFKQRVTTLEGIREKADIQAMTDAALDAHISTLEFGTTECYSAIIARVMRHPSAFPVSPCKSGSEIGGNRQAGG